MWNKDEMEGKKDQLKGKAKERIGEMTGNTKMANEGRADQVS